MNPFKRATRQPDPAPEPIALPEMDTLAILREEFDAADLFAGPELDRVRRQGTIVERVDVDEDRGSAVVTFVDGTQVTVATSGEDILQLRSAARLADTRLTLSRVRTDAPGRVLVFTAASWTIYLTVDIARV